MRLYTPQGQPNWLLTKELLYEEVRRAHYSAKPSRFNVSFVCFTAADLQQFRNEAQRHFDNLYEVELVNPSANSHVADWTAMNILATDNMAAIEAKAHIYWQANNPMKKELATESPLRIVKRI